MQAGAEFYLAEGVSLGLYFGYSKEAGFTVGVLAGNTPGAGGPISASASFFGQVTSAKAVCDLKGPSAQVGGSGGEGPVIGGDLVIGDGYQGIQGSVGVGVGFPFEIHGLVSVLFGYDNTEGWKWPSSNK